MSSARVQVASAVLVTLYLQAQCQQYLLFANSVFLRRLDLSSSVLTNLYGSNEGSVVGVDYDLREGWVFWSEVFRHTIVFAHLRTGTIFSTPVSRESEDDSIRESVAWDWVGKKLYWTDSARKTIEVLDPGTGYRKVILQFEDVTPRIIKLDPRRRVMYWTAWSADQHDGQIIRTSMDGKGSTVLFDSRIVSWPNALAIDYDTQTLYWIDALKDTISKSDTSGLNHKVILELNATKFYSQWHPFSMDFFNGSIFFGDLFNESILTLEVKSPNRTLALVKALGFRPGGLHVVHLERQPVVAQNPCGVYNGECSHLCLLSFSSPSGRSCVCPDKVSSSLCNDPAAQNRMFDFLVSGSMFLTVTLVLILVIIALLLASIRFYVKSKAPDRERLRRLKRLPSPIIPNRETLSLHAVRTEISRIASGYLSGHEASSRLISIASSTTLRSASASSELFSRVPSYSQLSPAATRLLSRAISTRRISAQTNIENREGSHATSEQPSRATDTELSHDATSEQPSRATDTELSHDATSEQPSRATDTELSHEAAQESRNKELSCNAANEKLGQSTNKKLSRTASEPLDKATDKKLCHNVASEQLGLATDRKFSRAASEQLSQATRSLDVDKELNLEKNRKISRDAASEQFLLARNIKLSQSATEPTPASVHATSEQLRPATSELLTTPSIEIKFTESEQLSRSTSEQLRPANDSSDATRQISRATSEQLRPTPNNQPTAATSLDEKQVRSEATKQRSCATSKQLRPASRGKRTSPKAQLNLVESEQLSCSTSEQLIPGNGKQDATRQISRATSEQLRPTPTTAATSLDEKQVRSEATKQHSRATSKQIRPARRKKRTSPKAQLNVVESEQLIPANGKQVSSDATRQINRATSEQLRPTPNNKPTAATSLDEVRSEATTQLSCATSKQLRPATRGKRTSPRAQLNRVESEQLSRSTSEQLIPAASRKPAPATNIDEKQVSSEATGQLSRTTSEQLGPVTRGRPASPKVQRNAGRKFASSHTVKKLATNAGTDKKTLGNVSSAALDNLGQAASSQLSHQLNQENTQTDAENEELTSSLPSQGKSSP